MLGSPAQPDELDFIDPGNVYLAKFKALAKELGVNVVPGTLPSRPPAASASGQKAPPLVNCAYWIDRQGEIKGSYQKKNLWHPERPVFAKGLLPHAVFETEFGRTAFLVCWDVMFPEAFKALSAQNVDLIIVPSYWLGTDGQDDLAPGDTIHNPDSEAVFLRAALTTRAFETGACVVFVNASGPESEGYIAQSQVTLPLRGVQDGVILGPESDATVVDVGEGWKRVVRDAEKVYRIRQDMKREDWHY